MKKNSSIRYLLWVVQIAFVVQVFVACNKDDECPRRECYYPEPVPVDLTSDSLTFEQTIELSSLAGQTIDFRLFQVDSMRLLNGRARYVKAVRPESVQGNGSKVNCPIVFPWRWVDTARTNRVDFTFRDTIVLFASYDRRVLESDTLVIESELTHFYWPCRSYYYPVVGSPVTYMFEKLTFCRLSNPSWEQAPNSFIVLP
jgi:hypothetical protein